jgi:hypothetical protein
MDRLLEEMLMGGFAPSSRPAEPAALPALPPPARRVHARTCVVCGAAVALMRLRTRNAGGSVTFRDGSRLGLTGAVPAALCHPHYVVWLTRRLATVWLYELHDVTRVGMSRQSFAFDAHHYGMSARTLKKRLVRAQQDARKGQQRAQGSHLWALQRAKEALFREEMERDPWKRYAIAGAYVLPAILGYLRAGKAAA